MILVDDVLERSDIQPSAQASSVCFQPNFGHWLTPWLIVEEGWLPRLVVFRIAGFFPGYSRYAEASQGACVIGSGICYASVGRIEFYLSDWRMGPW